MSHLLQKLAQQPLFYNPSLFTAESRFIPFESIKNTGTNYTYLSKPANGIVYALYDTGYFRYKHAIKNGQFHGEQITTTNPARSFELISSTMGIERCEKSGTGTELFGYYAISNTTDLTVCISVGIKAALFLKSTDIGTENSV